MNKKFIVFYTIFASLVFIFSLSYLGYNLYTEYVYGDEAFSVKTKSLTNNIKNAAQKGETNFYEDVKRSIGNLDDYSFIEIKKNGKSIYQYPNGYTLEQTSSRLSKTYNIELTTDIGRVKISANIYKLKPYSVYYYGKITFLIILFITLLTIVLIIIANAKDKKSDGIVEVTPDEEINSMDISENTENLNAEENDFALDENKEVEIKNESVENDIQDEISKESEEIDEPEVVKPAPVKLPYEDYKPVDLKDTDAAPQGLFNPDTGLGWESYLKTRLDSEINRAISSEFDLSLFVIKVPDINRASELCSNICGYLTLQFQFKDLLFEYKKDCFVGIKISMNLDEALTFSEKLYADIKNLIGSRDCYIGISTRSIRMVSAERLLLEADQALQHAQEDSVSPVIAFRVDTEKYKQFLEHNN